MVKLREIHSICNFIISTFCLSLSLQAFANSGSWLKWVHSSAEDGEFWNNDLSSELERLMKKHMDENVSNSIVATKIKRWPLLRTLQTLDKLKLAGEPVDPQRIMIVDYTKDAGEEWRAHLIQLREVIGTPTVQSVAVNNASGVNKVNGKDCMGVFGNGDGSQTVRGGPYYVGDWSSTTKKSKRQTCQLEGLATSNQSAASDGVAMHEAKNRAGKPYPLTEEGLLTARNHGCIVFTPVSFLAIRDQLCQKMKRDTNAQTLVYTYPQQEDLEKNPYWDPSCRAKLERRGQWPPKYIEYAKGRKATPLAEASAESPVPADSLPLRSDLEKRYIAAKKKADGQSIAKRDSSPKIPSSAMRASDSGSRRSSSPYRHINYKITN